jgi:hypothetical protein
LIVSQSAFLILARRGLSSNQPLLAVLFEIHYTTVGDKTMATNNSVQRSKLEIVIIQTINLAMYPVGIIQVLSYRLIGVKATYRWGYLRAKTSTKVDEWKFAFSFVFPAVVCLVLGILIKLQMPY